MNTGIKINLGLIVLLFLPGCQKWIDPDINNNPNEPLEVTMPVLLSFIEADVAYKVGGGIEMIASPAIFMQQLDGVDRQMLAISNYIINPNDVVYIWGDSYAEILMDAKKLRELANQKGSPYNSALADILTAFTLGQMTDVWDKIPWSEALQEDQILQPVYDDQESVYQAIFAMLDRAIDSLSVAEDPAGIEGDYIYEGNAAKWIMAAHALKARYKIHLTGRNGEEAYTDALDELPLAFSGNDEDLQFNFGTGESEANQLYQFMRDRNDIRMGAFFIDMLTSDNDPRLPVFAYPDKDGNYTGSAPGQANGLASAPGPAVAAPDAPVYIITYVELLFIKAEALLKTGRDENLAREALVSAVTSSLNKYGVEDEEWIQSYNEKINTLSGNDLFKEIMTQKYIATFYQAETYHSWRRTGYPEIQPNPIGQFTSIPTRFPYPISEFYYNQNVPKGISVLDHVWWDVSSH